MNKALLAAIFLLATNRPQIAEDQAGKAPFVREPISALSWAGFPQGRQPSADPKACSEVYPAPQNAQQWTKCQRKDVTECGGPPECLCNVDERLLTYTCAEGTYRKCEPDNSCLPDSPSL